MSNTNKKPTRREYPDPVKLKILAQTVKIMGTAMGDCLKAMPGTGFALLVFTFDGPEMAYISSAERDTMIAAMKEFIAKHSQLEESKIIQ